MEKDVRKMFKHDLLLPFTLNRIDSPEGRFYETNVIIETPCYVRPGGVFRATQRLKYPSVTSVLANYYGTEWLDKWKARVGEETANKISTQAKRRGTAMHNLYEKFLLNEDYTQGAMPVNIAEFHKVKSYLQKHIATVRGIELPLFSSKLGIAGTCDAFVDLWHVEDKDLTIPCILDFKTSKRKKTEQEIESYFVQTTIYAMMIEELYNIEVPWIMIIMTVDHDKPQFFPECSHTFRPKVFEILQHENSRKRTTEQGKPNGN